jgi:hypothetical protein
MNVEATMLRTPHRFPYVEQAAAHVAGLVRECGGSLEAAGERALREVGPELEAAAWEIRRRRHRVRIAWWLELAREYETWGPEHEEAELLLRVLGTLRDQGVAPFDWLGVGLVAAPDPVCTKPAAYLEREWEAPSPME